MVECLILGPLELRVDGAVAPLRPGRQRALVAQLALRANEVVASDRLIDELWNGNPPATAGKALQNTVSQLRKLLPDGVLMTQAPGYLLHVDPELVDAERFATRVADGRRAVAAGRFDEAVDELRRALALWRGEALGDVHDVAFADAERARLDELRLTALEDRIEAELALGGGGDLVPEIEGLVAQHPLRERLRAHLMLALYRSGRQADALAAYARTRQTLVD